MCDPNENNILSIDFSSVNDVTNWQTTSSNPLQTVGGKLLLNPSANDSSFTRVLGTMAAGNNRVRVKTNLVVTKDAAGPNEVDIMFELLAGATVIDSGSAPLANLNDGEEYAYFFDKTFKTMQAGALSLRITIPDGWQNDVSLSDLVVDDSTYCFDNVRTYFVIDGLLEDALTAMSSGIELVEWKVNEVETLTPAFFAENNSIGGNPIAEWLFAKANLDGTERVSDDVTPNSFNPFVDEFGLEFDTVGSFHGGKPLGTVSGSDYGAGVLQIGLEKPAVLNGELSVKKGAFFIDIDFSQDLKVVFNVLSNQMSTNVFSNPAYYREYTIEWDSEQCIGTFKYTDVPTGTEVDQANNGFLSGITGLEVSETIVACDGSFAPSGAIGNFSFDIEFGVDTGQAGISYNAGGIPDRFILEWDGQIFDSGFVGQSSYDAQLIAAGVDPSDINTTAGGNGAGQLVFDKTTAQPTRGTVTVLAPLGSTAWNIQGICPAPPAPNIPPIVSISVDDSTIDEGDTATFSITASDSDGTIASWSIDFGDGDTDSGTGRPPTTISHQYNTDGNFAVVIIVIDDDGAQSDDDVNMSVAAAPVTTPFSTSQDGYGSTTLARNVTLNATRHRIGSLQVGGMVYNDVAGTQPLNGQNRFYKISGGLIKVNGSGLITERNNLT